MKTFTIDAENSITAHATRKEAREAGAPAFSTEEKFADTIGNDSKRLVETWNSLHGVTPVKKFANRKVATERIWKAIQGLAGPAAPVPDESPDAVAERRFREQIELIGVVRDDPLCDPPLRRPELKTHEISSALVAPDNLK